MSSFYDDSSLVVIPSGYKTSKIYAEKPTDGSGDLTFTRASGATRVASNGLIEKVRSNRFTYSQALANAAWLTTTDGGTITKTANAGTAPDGTNTATRIQIVGGGTYSLVYQSGVNPLGLVVISGYFKRYGSTNQTFRLFGDNGSALSATLTATDTWQRFSYVMNATSTGADGIAADASNNAYDILVWGMQIETGDIATDYIPTTTAAVSVGPVSNVPRLDYLGSSCPRLLLEPQRTNLLNYSEQFNSTPYWDLGSAATITANSVISPDGTLSADTLTANGAGQIYVRNNVYLGTAQTCSSSIFVKKANHSLVGFRNSGTTSAHDVFNFDTKTWTNNSGATLSYEEFGNGWFRLKSTNTDAVNLNYYWSVIPAVTTSGTENTTASNLSVYIWGGQAEQNASYCTSYIPTPGASSVTRVADAASKTGISSLIGQTEGVIFLDFVASAKNADTGGSFSVLFTAGEVGTNFQIYTASNNLRFYKEPTTIDFVSSVNLVEGQRYKIAYAYKAGQYAFYVNGVQEGTSTNGSVPAVSSIYINQFSNGTYQAQNKFNQTLLFKTRLTNAQLAELTTL